MQQIKQTAREVVERNIGLFSYFHLHLTVEPTYVPTVRHTSIVLPYQTDYGYTQVITTCKFSQLVGYDALVDMVPMDKVLGFKIEGLDIQDVDKLTDFCYIEDHFKDTIRREGFNLAFSLKHKKIVGAHRIYDQSELTNDWRGEVCIFEEWIEDIEGPYLRLPKEDQYKFIEKYCLE